MTAMYETNLIGKRQEILDEVFNVESDKTPFLSALKVGKRPLQMLATWVAEIIPDAVATGTLDGAAYASPGRVDRYLITGCSQHFRKPWAVTTLAQISETAGVKDEAAHQMMLAMKLLRRSMEVQFLSTGDCTVETGGTPWTTRGALSWLATSAQALYPLDSHLLSAAATQYTGAVASLTETLFRAQLDAAYAAVKQPVNLDGYVGTDLKLVFDNFTNVYPVASTTSQPRTSYRIDGNSEFMQDVDIINMSSGKVALHLDPFVACTTSTGAQTGYSPKSGVFVNLNQWDVGYMLAAANTNLPPDGSGKRGYIDAVAVLRCKNPLGQVSVYTTT